MVLFITQKEKPKEFTVFHAESYQAESMSTFDTCGMTGCWGEKSNV